MADTRAGWHEGQRRVDQHDVEFEVVGFEGNGSSTYYAQLEPVDPQPGLPAQVRVKLGGDVELFTVKGTE